MPGRHSPPVIAEPQDKEQLKKPKRRGAGTRRPKGPYLYQMEMQFLDPPERLTASSTVPPPKPPSRSPAASRTSDSSAAAPPEAPNTPALSLPSKASTSTGTSRPQPLKHSQPTTQNLPKPGAESSPPGGVITVNGVAFHHASEAEFARLLNYYGIEWQYEPHQFPLQWREGRPVEMFAPDFYLTEYDLYIELTTMRQSLVRRKNRKLRLLRALYPEINIKLLYRRDYQRLLERFGIRQDEVEAEIPFASRGSLELGDED
jgi:hypothetical protein